MSNGICTDCNGTASASSSHLVGWTLESSGRGTLSLILTCATTTALCTWVVIHPRIDKRRKFRHLHKVALFLKTFIAPEFIAVEAAQEWNQARHIIQESSAHTNGELRLVEAFYIGMFGIRYRTSLGTKILWPNQWIWLLQNGLFNWKTRDDWGLDRESIRDKNNADATAKLFAVLQTVWFVAQSIMRAAHNLPLAPLEAMTLGYIPLFVVAYAYWWLKPKDIETPSVVDLPAMPDTVRKDFEAMELTSSFDNEGKPEQSSLWQVWALMPRMFEKEALDLEYHRAEQEFEKRSMLYNSHFLICQRRGCKECKRLRPSTVRRRHEMLLANWDPTLYHSKLWPIICLVGVSFPALHLIAWDTVFPTRVEAWLWRAAAMTSIGSMLVFMQFEKVIVRWSDPLMAIKILSPALYLVSRFIMLGGAIAAFRASDPRTYDTYVVSTYWVHLL
ncbi:hypothetical protein BAUCODRAFT_499244 [Baudoinia panamericana UAMH 10762]|uniref:Uncharacterized protein n=1 Tax=Baudoinia panamericana (strain UAMH 10762) TaxID=717646 RepID=M2N9B9_BAUPA|nr:uncharacterized protein BAUCODRAFT_499244 [Baudoinia panamericana UAMH 10762]EMC95699.1 hypothetical protein BAUCODRAFT_499244 [Baudoinia panamericana UAMH 10762]